MSQAEDRAAAQPGGLPAVGEPVSHRGQIREAVPGYPDSFDAFKRMFERDKDELRELGIPLETGTNAAADDEPGYRISRQAYVLPEIRLEPDEAAVLGLAARVWRRAELAGRPRARCSSCARPGSTRRTPPSRASSRGCRPVRPPSGRCGRRCATGARCSFGYRAAGRSTPQQRHLEPWGVVNRHGRWYVAGPDTDRGETRVFRLSRIDGPVSFTRAAGLGHGAAGDDVREPVRSLGHHAADRCAPPCCGSGTGPGYGLRRGASDVRPDPEHPGWDLVEVPFSDAGLVRRASRLVRRRRGRSRAQPTCERLSSAG